MSLLTEVLIISGVAMDLVGAAVLSHAHNAESIVQIKQEIGEEGAALGEEDIISTHAQLLAEKRIGFLILTAGLSLYLAGLVLKSSEGVVPMAILAGGVVVAGVAVSVVFTSVIGRRVRKMAHKAEDDQDSEEMPEQ